MVAYFYAQPRDYSYTHSRLPKTISKAFSPAARQDIELFPGTKLEEPTALTDFWGVAHPGADGRKAKVVQFSAPNWDENIH